MRKSAPANKTPVRKSRSKKKKSFFKSAPFLIGAFLILLILAVGYHYREALAYYFSFKSRHEKTRSEEDKLTSLRNYQVMIEHEDLVIGFDVSEYQGDIDWTKTDTIEQTFPLGFVFVRATAGKNYTDLKFKKNWLAAKRENITRGAYHYYRPDENSLEQAELFIKNVKLHKGDLPPVLDIEKVPEGQSVDSLKKGLKRWLERIEKHYKVTPIIYCGESYYCDFLEKEFSHYNLWIANYNFFVEEIDPRWEFWQFTEKGTIPGIKGPVDLNIFNGDVDMLDELKIKK